MSAFDSLEADFFGDLAEDTHGVWEVFESVRLHYPGLTDEQVFERGYEYIARWLQSDWIRMSDAQLHPSSLSDSAGLLHFLQQHGPAATRYLENSPSIDISEKAQRIYESQTI